MCLLKEDQLEAFYKAIESDGHSCDRKDEMIFLNLPENVSETWFVTKDEDEKDLYHIERSGTRGKNPASKPVEEAQGREIIEAACKKAKGE